MQSRRRWPILKIKTSIIAILAVFALSLFAIETGSFSERILAVVEGEVITSSEVEIALLMETGGQKSQSELGEDALRDKVEALVDERLILLAAEAESIQVDQSRLDEVFQSRWQKLVEGYGGESALEAALEKEGYSLLGFKRKTRQQISDYLLKQSYVGKHFGRIDVTDDDVEEFFNEYADSLPKAPAEVKLDGLVVHLTPDSAGTAAATAKIEGALARIRGGEDFATVAVEVSEDEATAEKGGLLGTFGHGDLLHELDSAAFSLEYDEVGGPIESPMGYHLLKVIDRSAGKITLMHILVRLSLSPDRFNELIALTDTIYSICVASPDSMKNIPKRFTSYNIEFIEESDWLPISYFQDELKNKMIASDKGDIIGPEESENSFEIYRVFDKSEDRALTIEDDRQVIEEFARQIKSSRLIEEHIDKLREDYYIEIRI